MKLLLSFGSKWISIIHEMLFIYKSILLSYKLIYSIINLLLEYHNFTP